MADSFSFLLSSGYGNQIRGYPQATDLEPTDAFIIDRLGAGTMFIEADAFAAPYDVAMGLPSPVNAATTILFFQSVRTFTIGADALSRASCKTPPVGGNVTLSVQQNGVEIGQIVFQPNAIPAVVTMNGAATFNAPDVLNIVSPANVFGLANIAITFSGSR